jgi:hypothetical protein
MSSAYNYNAATPNFLLLLLPCFVNLLKQLYSLSAQPDLGYQEKYYLKVRSTEHKVHSIRIRSIKHTTATYTMINFHSNSKNQQFFVMIFVSSSLVTVMLLLNTFQKYNKSLLVPDVTNV